MTAQSAIPLKWYVPFAQSDSARVEIPVTSSDATRASQTLGFPPLTMQPPAVGGVPPQGEDFNGAINQVARIAWWVLNGGGWPYDSTFATNSNIGGYPNGAVLQSADFLGQWISTADNNQNNPDTVGTSWVPGFQYGLTAVTGQTGGTTTLTPLQAAKRGITISGTLTSALTVIMPTWIKDWSITNNTTGAFATIVKTAAGSGVTIPQNGAPTAVAGDGTNVTQSPQNIAAATSNTHPVQFGQVGHGQCKLSVVSATSLRLIPLNGNNVIVNGIPLQIPSGGVAVSNSGLAASTVYYVYLAGSTASPSLVFSTTGHATGANGVEVMTGDATRTLVGMIYTTAGGQFFTTTNVVACINWFNRSNVPAINQITSSPSITNTTIAKVTTQTDTQFLSWSNEGAIGMVNGYANNSTAGNAVFTQLQLDGVGWGVISGANSYTASANVPYISYGMSQMVEGLHLASLYGYVNAGTGVIVNGNLQVTVRG